MEPWITVIVVAYKRYNHIPIMIHSFLIQTNPNWKMVILHDGPDEEHATIVQPYLEKHSNIEYHQSKRRYNDWGHSLRNWGINEFVTTPWTLITNDDNYYVPTFLHECYSVISDNNNAEFIMVDGLMNTPVSNTLNRNRYQVQYTFPKTTLIDMGSFILKQNILKTVGFKSKTISADGVLVDSILDTYPDLICYKINQTLFVHN